MLLAGHSLYLKTMSFDDDYALLEEFLRADPDFVRLDLEADRLLKVRDESNEAADKATRNYHKWMCCESALQDKGNLLTTDLDGGDLDFIFSADLVSDYLADGQAQFERMKRAELVKAGEASKQWLQAEEDYRNTISARHEVRQALVQTWREKRSAEQEAE